MIYIESRQTDPTWNLALESWLFDCETREDVLYLWQNTDCVVIGKNQSAHMEVDLNQANTLGVPVLRRETGGGAVWHDLGNLNFTYITDDDPEADSPYEAFLRPLMEVLAGQGIPVVYNGRNDLCVADRKISGSAARMRNGRLLHHGTLLVCSNLAQMDSLLTPDAEKLQRNGVRSVKSRVANLTEFAPGLTAAHLKDLLRERFGASTCLELTPENLTQIRQRQQKFQDPAWNFSK